MTDTSNRNEHRPRLGRGLAALLGEVSPDTDASERANSVQQVPIEFLSPNSYNPRRVFAGPEMDELTASVRERGILQPILVRRKADATNAYEIIAGERRWRAAQLANLHEVPICVFQVEDHEAIEIAIIENVQRTDLNPIEEATGYDRLANEHGYSHPDIARVVGKSRSHVANTLRLLNLSDYIKSLVVQGKLSAGHARALLAVQDPEVIADRIVARGMTVREVEGLSEHKLRVPRSGGKSMESRSADTRAMEIALSTKIGSDVVVRRKGDACEVRIQFHSFGQLEDFLARLV